MWSNSVFEMHRFAGTVIVCFSAFASPPMAFAQVFKCPGPSGQTVFQQMPCDNGEELNIKPASGNSTSTLDNDRQLRFMGAIATGRVMVGMTPQQVRTSWGTPTKVNRTVSSSGVTEQWVYRKGHGAANYVHFRDGVVSSAQ